MTKGLSETGFEKIHQKLALSELNFVFTDNYDVDCQCLLKCPGNRHINRLISNRQESKGIVHVPM